MSLVADLNMVGLGWSVWSRTRRDHDDIPIGGVVVGIDRLERIDDETGEVSDAVIFRLRNPYRRPPLNQLTLEGSDVNLPAGAERPERNRIYALVRTLCAAVGKPTKSRWLTATDMECVTDAYRLLMALEAR